MKIPPRNTCIQPTYQKTNMGRFSILWFLFLFTCIFPPMFLPIDIRFIIAITWILVARKIVVKSKLVSAIFYLAIYSILVLGINAATGRNVDSFFSLRYFRTILMAITISSMISITNSRRKYFDIIVTLSWLLTFHAGIIILQIIFPSIKDTMYIYCGTTRIFYRYRAGGFVNGFDFAGFYTNIGIILTILLYQNSREKRYLLFFIVCLIATFFTSRLNMFASILVLFYLRFKVGRNVPLLRLLLTVFLIIISIIGISFIAITTDLFVSLRLFLFKKYGWIEAFYSLIIRTYSDNIVSQVIQEQFTSKDDSVFQIIGTGSDIQRDPGYLQLLYSIGIIGTILAVIPYLMIFFQNIRYVLSRKDLGNSISISATVLGCIAIYQLVFNFKILFLYATGAFEMLYVLYVVNKNIRAENRIFIESR